MKVFITGSTGYIGHKLAMAAADRGFDVTALVRNAASPNLPKHPAISFCRGDITDYASVAKAMAGCDYVLHAAALTQLWHKDRSLFYRINVRGTRNVLEAALFHHVERFVLTSTGAVLGPSQHEPISEDKPRYTPFENDYEISKYCAEELLKEYVGRGLPALIVAPPRVYGPGLDTKANPINHLIRNALKRNLAFMPSANEVVANYAFIDDVVEGHFLALEKGECGEKYILGGENVSYRRFFDTIAEASNQKLRIVSVPVVFLKVWTAIVFGLHFLIGRHTHLSPKLVKRLLQNRALSCEKAVRQLGYRITPFCQGIKNTVNYLKSSYA